MSPEQCRAGRAWIGWSQGDLAAKAGVSLSTVRDFELSDQKENGRKPIAATLGAMRAALEGAGIGFSFILEDGREIPCGISFAKKDKLSG